MAKKIEERRLDSTKNYVDALSEQNSKINIVRVDLAYKKPYSSEITLDEVTRDLNRMMNNRRGKPSVFGDQVGYVIKKEYTEDKGPHIHALFIFDGQNVQKDVFKGEQIGKYWEELTENKGCYYNCNRNNYEQSGIGMLDHRDSDKRKILDDKVILYLCKDEQDIESIKENKKDRSFSRGVIPKKKGNMGRPREQS